MCRYQLNQVVMIQNEFKSNKPRNIHVLKSWLNLLSFHEENLIEGKSEVQDKNNPYPNN